MAKAGDVFYNESVRPLPQFYKTNQSGWTSIHIDGTEYLNLTTESGNFLFRTVSMNAGPPEFGTTAS